MHLKLLKDPSASSFEVDIWPEDSVKFTETARFESSHVFTIDRPISAKRAIVSLLASSGERFFMGTWYARKGVFKKPTLQSEGYHTIGVEQSALNRLNEILAGTSGLRVQIKSKDQVIEARTEKIEVAVSGGIFKFSGEVGAIEEEDVLNISTDLRGMSYSFRTVAAAKDDHEVVAHLPKEAARILSRTVPRTQKKSSVVVNEEFHADLIDISVAGCQLEFSKPIELPEMGIFKLKFTDQFSISFEIPGLLVSGHRNQAHFLFSYDACVDAKKIFFSIFNEFYPPFSLSENPQEAWKCLEGFGYTGLSQEGAIQRNRDQCLETWEKLIDENWHFQPVIFKDQEAFGTIAATQVAKNHWIPHALSAKVSESTIPVTEALYLSWPSYLQSLGFFGWISTWYDANKPWHNRFYKVFISENKKSPHVNVMDRHWLIKKPESQNKITDPRLSITKLQSDGDEKSVIDQWDRRYASFEKTNPYRDLLENNFEIFKSSFLVIRFNGAAVGLVHENVSKNEISPASVMSVAHINIFCSETKNNSEKMVAVVESISSELFCNPNRRNCITLDFDSPVDFLAETSYDYFMPIRCLAFSPLHLGSLISNNLLSFDDIRLRRGK